MERMKKSGRASWRRQFLQYICRVDNISEGKAEAMASPVQGTTRTKRRRKENHGAHPNMINSIARGKPERALARGSEWEVEGKWAVGCPVYQSELCSGNMVPIWIGEDWGQGEGIRAWETSPDNFPDEGTCGEMLPYAWSLEIGWDLAGEEDGRLRGPSWGRSSATQAQRKATPCLSQYVPGGPAYRLLGAVTKRRW